MLDVILLGKLSPRTYAMASKTSRTHPLRIDRIGLPEGGSIGLTFCSGKKQADAFTGRWDRDLLTDLQTIRAWNATAVVTLIEPHEFTTIVLRHRQKIHAACP
ncbi:hypothetical protein [Azospirillum sp.]|uniref:hypothetical protein n=1 Tax=Azospirillum sp. TaxID=34012 RepID=UPI002D626BFF|nr:hypothetical protein [Azospirillum sp.]HYF86174.1 hypothetical protein [Azospirillum sp.]